MLKLASMDTPLAIFLLSGKVTIEDHSAREGFDCNRLYGHDIIVVAPNRGRQITSIKDFVRHAKPDNQEKLMNSNDKLNHLNNIELLLVSNIGMAEKLTLLREILSIFILWYKPQGVKRPPKDNITAIY